MDHDLPPELAGRRDDLYARITKRGRFLRYRRIAVVSAVVAAVIAVPVVAVAAIAGSDHGTGRVAAVGPTSAQAGGTGTASTTSSSAPRSSACSTELCRRTNPPSISDTTVPSSVPIVLANVVGATKEAGALILSRLGMCVQIQFVANATVPMGTVVSSSPAPGVRVEQGTVVTLTVASGAPTTRSTNGAAGGGAAPPAAVVPATVEPSPPATLQPTTTTALACRNSNNPACGPFRWDPPVHNRPATVSVVSVAPSAPKVGDSVTFTVHAADPDNPFYPNLLSVAVPSPGSGVIMPTMACGISATLGDGAHVWCVSGCPAIFTRYGPWDTPPPGHAGDLTLTFTHAYAKSGSYKVTFFAGSGGNCDPGPYGSRATVTVTLNVSP